MADVDTPAQGMGCFAKGCLITSLAGLTFLILIFGGAWFLYEKAVHTYTSAQPAELSIVAPTDAQFSSANQMLERLRSAAASNKSETIEFSATDLNALFARHPDFANPRRKIRFAMANSIMTVEMSVPFQNAPLPGLNGRWLNCTARFGLDYVYGQFTFLPKSLVANGHSAPALIFSESFVSSFNRSFSKSFSDTTRRNAQAAAFWDRIKSMTVRDDKLVVTTEAAG